MSSLLEPSFILGGQFLSHSTLAKIALFNLFSLHPSRSPSAIREHLERTTISPSPLQSPSKYTGIGTGSDDLKVTIVREYQSSTNKRNYDMHRQEPKDAEDLKRHKGALAKR